MALLIHPATMSTDVIRTKPLPTFASPSPTRMRLKYATQPTAVNRGGRGSTIIFFGHTNDSNADMMRFCRGWNDETLDMTIRRTGFSSIWISRRCRVPKGRSRFVNSANHQTFGDEII